MRLATLSIIGAVSSVLCTAALAADKVQVNAYVEALCPYCAEFTAGELADVFKTGVAEIADIRLIPFGNARQKAEGKYACQHGPDECQLNRVLACGIAIKPNQAEWFPFASCVEGKYPDELAAVEDCAKAANLDIAELNSCVSGTRGDDLIKRAAEETNSLQPAHKYVPWIVVNGVPLGENYKAVKSVICASYAGPKPPACLSVPLNASHTAVTIV